MTEVFAYLPSGGPPPGKLQLVWLNVVDVAEDGLVLPRLTLSDVEGPIFAPGVGLQSNPQAGGGPRAELISQRRARAFGLTNAAWHARRLLDAAEQILGRELPPLRVRIGVHHDGYRRWGGGHYRLPAQRYSDRPEIGPVESLGEVHLGGGQKYVTHHGEPYFHAPAHNVALISHEVAHHICRHTADFRLNRMRAQHQQTNCRTPVEEGTCDYLAGVMLGHPDIYGWHRRHVDPGQLERRCLSAGWTMAEFRGGRDTDPHADGAVWAAALWRVRNAATAAGVHAAAVDTLLLKGLESVGSTAPQRRDELACRDRRQFGRLLQAMLDAPDPDDVADLVEREMAQVGIRPGWSNAQARDALRVPARR